METRLYIGNLSYSIGTDDLQELFAQFGTVESVQVITDRDTGRSKGFGFVQMGTLAEAEAAIEALHQQQHLGRTLTVNIARPREPRFQR